MAKTILTKAVALTAGTVSPYYIKLDSDTLFYSFTGTFAMSGNLTITHSGTPVEGMVVVCFFSGAITTGGNTLSVMGTSINDKVALQKFVVLSVYSGAAWKTRVFLNFGDSGILTKTMISSEVYDDTTIEMNASVGLRVKDAGISAAKIATDAVESAKIKDKNVTLGKIADVTRGSVLVGDASGRPAELVAKAAAQLLVGDGNDLVSVPVTGDVAITSGGVTTIQAAAINTLKIANDAVTKEKIPAAAGIELTKLAATTPTIVVVSDGSGFFVPSATTALEILYMHGVSPGSAVASKALVLGASKDVDLLDIGTLYLNGTAITKTAEQINYSATSVKNYSADSVLDETADIHLVDTSAGTITIELPLLSAAKQKVHLFKKTSGSNSMIITRSAGSADVINNKSLADVASITVSGSDYFCRVAMNTTQWDEIAV